MNIISKSKKEVTCAQNLKNLFCKTCGQMNNQRRRKNHYLQMLKNVKKLTSRHNMRRYTGNNFENVYRFFITYTRK